MTHDITLPNKTYIPPYDFSPNAPKVTRPKKKGQHLCKPHEDLALEELLTHI